MSSAKKAAAYWKKYTVEKKLQEEKDDDLLRAIRQGRLEIVKMLIEKGGVDVNGMTEKEEQCQGYINICCFQSTVESQPTLL